MTTPQRSSWCSEAEAASSTCGAGLRGPLGRVLGIALAAVLLGLASPATATAITRADVLARAKAWVDAGVTYNQGSYYGGYRQDCSGYVSMAWNTGTSYVTWTLPQVAHLITKDQLQPGDALLDNQSPTAYQHVLLFRGWANAGHTTYYAYEMTPPKAYAPTISPYPYWSTWAYSGNFRPFRYNGIQDTVRYNPVAPGDAGFAKHGAASGWTSFAGGVFGTAIYTYVGNTVRDNWARWAFDLSKLSGAGGYKIEAYVTSTHAGTKKAHYHINTLSGLKYSTVNQNALSNAWANLGTYALKAGSAWVELDDVTGEPYGTTESSQIVFDAIRLTYSNRAPVAVANSYTTTQNTALTVAAKGVLANDSDVDGNALTAKLVTNVARGKLALSSNGGFTYTPAVGYSGADSFTYCANDGAANSNTVRVSLAITPSPSPTPSPTPTPTVTPTVTVKLGGLRHGAMELGRRVTAKGIVTPTSLAGSKVTLTAQTKKGKKWLRAKTASALISSTGAYSWKYKPAKKGAYRVRASIAKTTTTVPVKTVWRHFKVK